MKSRVFRFALITGPFFLLLLGVSRLSAAEIAAAEIPAGVAASVKSPPALFWRRLEPGLELGLSVLPESSSRQNAAVLAVLRVTPAKHDFTLCMASQSGKALSMAGWSEREQLRAGINAGMYLPDMLTNTGYMRNGPSVNNDKQGARLGAFFVAAPRERGLAAADIIDRERPGWQKRLEQYDIVAQNYRLLNSKGQFLWPEGQEQHSIAAIAKDSVGRMLFILSQEPLTVQAFASRLSAFALDVATVMYVEGGRQAGLFVRLDTQNNAGQSLPGASAHPVPGGVVYVWKGRQSLLNVPGNPEALLPNIIGIKMQ